ncbi:MAG: type II toxin-antitoxin system RelE/ParE family toxin [Rhodospirillales bacterium]|nr:type II toxin-antitoxin system RelE/ParE family toxin [Rhodospirillales bacterium]
MSWAIEFLPAARADLRSLDRGAQDRIVRALDRLVRDPYASSNVKAMRGSETFRLRVGDWRVVYTLRDDRLLVLVLRVAHRREVYR